MVDVDAEVLIDLVESKPVLWDKTLDSYKDRVEKRNAWRDVCLALKADFDDMVDKEKNAFGQEVIRRWSNLRDSFAKYKRSDNESKKSGSGAKKRKKYVFGDRLKFLDKLYCSRRTEDSLDAGQPQGSENAEDDGELQGSSEGVNKAGVAPSNEKAQITSRSRVHKKPDEVDLKILKAIEKPCSKMSFMHSLLPHLEKFDTHEFLQFQVGVLNLIENINTRKQEPICNTSTVVNRPIPTASYHQYQNPMTNYQHGQNPEMYQQPASALPFQHFPQLPVSFHTNQQFSNPIPQTVTYQTNQNQYPNQNNQSHSLPQSVGQHNTTIPQHAVHKVQVEPTKPVSTAQYFHEFSNDHDHDSLSNQDGDVVYSPSTPGSSSNSEQIQF